MSQIASNGRAAAADNGRKLAVVDQAWIAPNVEHCVGDHQGVAAVLIDKIVGLGVSGVRCRIVDDLVYGAELTLGPETNFIAGQVVQPNEKEASLERRWIDGAREIHGEASYR